jgi:signal transduction histidine kinase
MKRGSTESCKPGKSARHKAATSKARADDRSTTATQQRRLRRERDEALEREKATAEVLRVINSSAGDLEPVFDAMVENALRLCQAEFGNLFLYDGENFATAALHGAPPAYAEARRHGGVVRHPHPDVPLNRVIRTKEVLHIADVRNEQSYIDRDPRFSELVDIAGARTLLLVPMLKDDKLVGAFAIYRREVRPFGSKQIELVRNFAAQAVIAIENARLLKELRQRTNDLSEALRHQTGSAGILRVIASSPTDVGPVLSAIVESACELCEAYDAVVVLKDGGELRLGAHHGPISMSQQRWSNDRTSISGRAVADRKPVHVHDVLSDEGADFANAREMSRVDGCHTLLGAPLLRDGESIGAIVLRRAELNPFSDKQIALLQTFADQAVIAIGNVRLFNEVQAKTRDLTESLDQQIATGEVLKAISHSAFDLQPVFDAIAENSVKLCHAERAFIFRFDGQFLRAISSFNAGPEVKRFVDQNPIALGRHSISARAGSERRTVHVADVHADPEYGYAVRDVDLIRTILAVPMLKSDELVGVITIYRLEVKPFTEKQVSLVETFAAQAVIAVENTRLINELRQSLEDLRAAQDRLIQTEKLASLGQLTAGIAHEIKNPLNFVNNFSALSTELIDEMKETLADAGLSEKKREVLDELTQTLKSNLEKVVQHGKRADSIVKNMLLHSREGSGEHRPVDINAIVDESLNLAYHGARAEQTGFNITMRRDFDPTVAVADVFPQEITRVLLNLISNGFYATARRKAEAGDGFEPMLTVTTRNLGDKVEICIRDNGIGIPNEVKDKIFNPFFTTKAAGEGTGLGLSMSHDIVVKQHGGTIDVDTQVGTFTEFKIVLPRAGASLANSGGQR